MSENSSTCAIDEMKATWECYRGELSLVEDQIRQHLDSKVALVNTVAAHILNSGGKRLRPLLLILSARMAGYTGHRHTLLASLIEYIHTATLLHDDVVDDADLRRGKTPARGLWGNKVSILVGDYLYSKAICHIVGFHNQGVNECLSEACRKMAEGELLQLSHKMQDSLSEDDYLKVAEYKTGSLMAAACRMGALLADATPDECEALFHFGQALGIAFQVADDTLDYSASQTSFGKLIGKDLGEGNTTLPLLHLKTHCTDCEQRQLTDILNNTEANDDGLPWVTGLMERYGSIEYARQVARRLVESAKLSLTAFEDSGHKRALLIIADYVVSRDH